MPGRDRFERGVAALWCGVLVLWIGYLCASEIRQLLQPASGALSAALVGLVSLCPLASALGATVGVLLIRRWLLGKRS